MKKEKKFIIIIGRKGLFQEKAVTEVLHSFICTDNRYSLLSDISIASLWWAKRYKNPDTAHKTCERLMSRVDEIAYCYIVNIKAESFVLGWWRENGKAVYTSESDFFEEEVLKAGGTYRLYSEKEIIENGKR